MAWTVLKFRETDFFFFKLYEIFHEQCFENEKDIKQINFEKKKLPIIFKILNVDLIWLYGTIHPLL